MIDWLGKLIGRSEGHAAMSEQSPALQAPARTLQHGDIVHEHEVLGLHSEHPTEDGAGFVQLFDLVQDRTGVRYFERGAKPDGPIRVCDGD